MGGIIVRDSSARKEGKEQPSPSEEGVLAEDQEEESLESDKEIQAPAEKIKGIDIGN